MDREEARELLPLITDGELDTARAAEVDALLEESPELRTELEQWAALRSCAHRGLCANSLPPELKNRVLASISTPAASRGRIFRLLPTLVALAALVMLAVIFRDDLLRSPTRNSTVAPAQAGVVSADDFAIIYRHCAIEHPHNMYAIGDNKLAAARESIGCKLGFYPVVPDLTDAGFVVQGCCSCFPQHPNGLQVAHVFYRETGQGHVVSFFALSKLVRVKQCSNCAHHPGDTRPYETSPAGNVMVLKWDDGPYSYAVVGQLGVDELRQLANRIDVAAIRSSTPAVASRE